MIISSGSIFCSDCKDFPFKYNGKHYRIGRGNNAFVFPGTGLGVWVGKVKRVTESMFLDAAKELAAKVTDQDLSNMSVYPELTRIRECSHAVTCAVIRRAVAETHADERVLENLEDTVGAQGRVVPRVSPDPLRKTRRSVKGRPTAAQAAEAGSADCVKKGQWVIYDFQILSITLFSFSETSLATACKGSFCMTSRADTGLMAET